MVISRKQWNCVSLCLLTYSDVVNFNMQKGSLSPPETKLSDPRMGCLEDTVPPLEPRSCATDLCGEEELEVSLASDIHVWTKTDP